MGYGRPIDRFSIVLAATGSWLSCLNIILPECHESAVEVAGCYRASLGDFAPNRSLACDPHQAMVTYSDGGANETPVPTGHRDTA